MSLESHRIRGKADLEFHDEDRRLCYGALLGVCADDPARPVKVSVVLCRDDEAKAVLAIALWEPERARAIALGLLEVADKADQFTAARREDAVAAANGKGGK